MKENVVFEDFSIQKSRSEILPSPPLFFLDVSIELSACENVLTSIDTILAPENS